MESMSVRELIVETQLQINRLAGNKRFTMLEPMIIWELNNAQDMLIKNALRVDPTNGHRYLTSQVDNTELQKVRTVNKELQVFKGYRTGVSYSVLPSDFGYLENDRSVVVEDCKTEYKAETINTIYTIDVITFSDSPLTEAPYYRNFSIKYNADVKTVVLGGVSSKKEKYEFVQKVIKELEKYTKEQVTATRLASNVYWESFEDLYYPNSFLVVTQATDSGTPTINLAIDGTDLAKTTTTVTRSRYAATNYNEVNNRSYKGDALYDILSSNYYDKPKPHSPVSQVAGGRIYVFNSERFLVSGIFMDYIRKPRRISLPLNQTSELDGNTHVKLCSLAAELFVANRENKTYQDKVQQNVNRT